MENQTPTPVMLEAKTFIYVKSGVYFESMLSLDEVNALLKSSKETTLVKIPCVLTLKVIGGQIRKVKEYYVDPKEVLAIVDNQSDLTEQYDTKPTQADELKEKEEVQEALKEEIEKKGK